MRWTDAAIIEEHQFALELIEHDIPVIAPLSVAGNTLHTFQDYACIVCTSRWAFIRVDNLEHLEWMGRFIGRLHAVGACKSFQHRLNLDVKTYGHLPYQFLIDQQFIPAAQRMRTVVLLKHY